MKNEHVKNTIKNNSRTCFGIFNACRFKTTTPNNVGQALPGNRDKKQSGFTLIELLVVVLIISILATIALPQYQKTVEKSRLTQAFTVVRALVPAMDAYYLEHGSYPTALDQLDVKIPWTGNVKPYHLANDWRSNSDWGLFLFNYPATWGTGISITRLSGPYTGTIISFSFTRTKNDLPLRTWICFEDKFTGNPGDYCSKVLKGIPVSGQTGYYTLALNH